SDAEPCARRAHGAHPRPRGRRPHRAGDADERGRVGRPWDRRPRLSETYVGQVSSPVRYQERNDRTTDRRGRLSYNNVRWTTDRRGRLFYDNVRWTLTGEDACPTMTYRGHRLSPVEHPRTRRLQ